jgi:hypothetical protein
MGGGVYNSTSISVDNITLQVASGIASIKDAGVSASKLASGVVSGWELVEEHVLTGAVASYDFSTTLTGDSDGGYMMIFNVVNSYGGAVNYLLRVNGNDANMNRQRLRGSGSSASAGTGSDAYIGIGTNSGSAGVFGYVLIPMSKKNQGERLLYSVCGYEADLMTNLAVLTTPASNVTITGLGFKGDQANSLGIGSTFMLFRRKA